METIRPAAWMMYLSGMAHFIAPFVSDFSLWSLLLVPAGVFWFVVGYLLIHWRSRLLAGLLFAFALAGAIAGFDMALGHWLVAPWIGWLICFSDLGAGLFLFATLWSDRTAVQERRS